jgi:hypothetical protein
MSLEKSSIEAFKIISKRWSDVVFTACASEMLQPYITSVNCVKEVILEIESFNEKTEDSKRFEAIKNVVERSNIESWPMALREGAENLGEILVNTYESHIESIFNGTTYEKYKSRYVLGIDQRAIEINKIKNICTEYAYQLIIRISEVQSKRMMLASQLPQLGALMNSDFDLGSGAKTFGSAFLAAAMPWVGIPVLVAHGANEYAKIKAAEAFKDKFTKELSELYDQMDSLGELAHSSFQQIRNYFGEKYKQVNINAIEGILADIDKVGEDTKHFFENVISELPQLEAAEKNFGIEPSESTVIINKQKTSRILKKKSPLKKQKK